MNAKGRWPLHTTIWAAPFHPNKQPPTPALWQNETALWTPDLVAHYVNQHTRPGDLILDPFASQPALFSAATDDRRVLLSHFSPATLLSLHASASPPELGLLDATFSRIADAPRRGQTLAHNLQALYETICPECARTAVASRFTWGRAAGELVLKSYTCPHCDSQGQSPTDMADGDLIASMEVRGAAYWGLLSRLVAPGDPLTNQARDLLNLYTPRALIAISELITAAEQRLDDPEMQQAGRAMILHVLQRCISLWEPDDTSWPIPTTQRLRPPARFVEHNVWLAFEQAYRTLRSRQPHSISLAANLQDLLRQDRPPRLLLLSQNIPALVKQLAPGHASLILSEPPRLDPTFYALNFLWTGWLYGRQRAGRLQAMLNARKMDWDWYARVMASALRSLRSLLDVNGRLVFAFQDRSEERLLALLLAASQAGFRPLSQAIQTPLMTGGDLPTWQLTFAAATPGGDPIVVVPANPDETLRQVALDAVTEVMTDRGEPAPLALLHSAAAIRWAGSGLLNNLHQETRKPVAYLMEQARLALTPEFPPPGLRYAPGQSDISLAQWTADPPPGASPLADRIEIALSGLLAEQAQPRSQLESQLYQRFPGWETPDAALLAACLAAYGAIDGQQVRLRAEDEPAHRARERGEMLLRLHQLGHKLGFAVWVAPWEQSAASGLVPLGRDGPEKPEDWAPAGLVWHEEGRPAYAFALATQALLQPWLAPPPPALGGCPRYVVVPGGRAGLLAFKLQRCPAWRSRLAETGWEFVKFRHIRHLAALPDLSLGGFRARVGLDPLAAQSSAQLALFAEERIAHAD